MFNNHPTFKETSLLWFGPFFCALTWGLMYSVHLAHGFSAEISLAIVEFFLLGWGMLFIRHLPPKQVLLLIAGMVVLVFLRPFSHVLYTIDIIPAAVVFLCYFSMGRLVATESRFRLCFVIALLAAALINTLANGAQWLGLDSIQGRLLIDSLDGPGGRTQGNIGHPNHVGFLIVMAIVVLERSWSERAQLMTRINLKAPWLLHAVWLSLFLLLVFGAASTKSRTTLACSVICAAFWLWTRRSRPAWLTCFLVSFPLWLLAAEWSLQQIWNATYIAQFQINSSGNTSGAHLQLLSTQHPRIGLWSHSIAIIDRHPWLGWGWKETRLAFLESFPDRPHNEIFEHAHNLFLELAISFGIPVSAGIFFLLLAIIWKLKPWRETQPDRLAAWLILTCVFAYSMVEFPLWYLHFMSLTALAAGYLWYNPRTIQGNRARLIPLRYRVACSLLVLTLSVAAFVDYQWAARAYARSFLWPPLAKHTLRSEDMFESQSTVLFGPYTSYAIVLQPTGIALTDEQLVYYGEHALSIAPEPKLLIKLIEAHKRLGHKGRAKHLAERALRQFPQEFRRVAPSSVN